MNIAINCSYRYEQRYMKENAAGSILVMVKAKKQYTYLSSENELKKL